jgi:hypothetical protein
MRLTSVVPAVCLAVITAFSGSVRAEDAAPEAATEAVPCRTNQPPLLGDRLSVVPDSVGYGGPSDAVLRTGRSTQVGLDAKDPDGDALTFAAGPLPEGATFDAGRGVLTWEPTSAQEGSYPITFEVSDGHHIAQRTIRLFVQPNRAPQASGNYPLTRVVRDESTAQAASMDPDSLPVIALDADEDELTFEARKLPSGARLKAVPGKVLLVWTPTEADLGEHEIVVDVADDLLKSTVRARALVMPAWAKQQYAGWFLLGGGPSSFLTQGSGELLVGGAFDVTLVAIREPAGRAYACSVGARESDCHAGYHRFYAQFEVLDSLRSGAPSMFTYGAGYSASFEWAPVRRYLIPHYGIEAGGLVRGDVGHLAQARPYLGLHLWSADRLWVNAALGYRVVPGALAELSGPTFALGVVISPW